MAYIHKIVHENPIIRRKVGFFADYFHFAAETIGQNDNISIDNPLSLVDKIIIQIEGNLENSSKYIISYLSNPLLSDHNPFLKEIKTFSCISPILTQYKDVLRKKDKVIKKWYSDNPDFLQCLKELRDELQSRFFDIVMKSILSHLKCEHDIEVHKDILILAVNCLVSEFLLNNRSKKDVKNLFQKILTSDRTGLPLLYNLEPNDDAKANFIGNRTLHQQFLGITDSLAEPFKEYFLIFQVCNMTVPDDFEFTYNKVTFYSPNHGLIKMLQSSDTNNFKIFLNDFLSENVGMLACVRSQFYSLEVAKNNALGLIKQELKFVNHSLGSNCSVRSFAFFGTANFKSLDIISLNENKDELEPGKDLVKLEDNPFSILMKFAPISKVHFLNCEKIYVEAMTTKNPGDYWHYLETLLTPVNLRTGKKIQIIDTVSTILTLNSEYHHKVKILLSYIRDGIMTSDRSTLGIPDEYKLKKIYSWEYEIEELNGIINHPFMNYIISDYLRPFGIDDINKIREHYSRVLWETQSERNFYIHRGLRNDKASIHLEGTIVRLGTRLRWLIFDAIEKNDGMPFHDIIEKLLIKARVQCQI